MFIARSTIIALLAIAALGSLPATAREDQEPAKESPPAKVAAPAVVIKVPPALPDPTKAKQPVVNVVTELPKTTPLPPKKNEAEDGVRPPGESLPKPDELAKAAEGQERPQAEKPKTGIASLLSRLFGKGEEKPATPLKAEQAAAPLAKEDAKKQVEEKPAAKEPQKAKPEKQSTPAGKPAPAAATKAKLKEKPHQVVPGEEAGAEKAN